MFFTICFLTDSSIKALRLLLLTSSLRESFEQTKKRNAAGRQERKAAQSRIPTGNATIQRGP
jgi:hypothetical protein